jgi:hypothetical protein
MLNATWRSECVSRMGEKGGVSERVEKNALDWIGTVTGD